MTGSTRTSRPKLGLFLLTASALLFAYLLHGQGPGGPRGGGPPTAAQELARLTKTLTLTEEQQAAILPILEKRHEEMGALMQGSSDGEANESKMHAMMDASNQEIRALLTEAQQALFDAMRPPKPPSGGAPPAGGGEPSSGTAPPSV